MKSQAEDKRACPSFPYCASTILQLGLTATNGQEQGQETEVEPGPLSPFHSIPFGNLLSWILGSRLMVLFSWSACPLMSLGEDKIFISTAESSGFPILPD